MAIEELQGGRYRYERLLGSGGMGEVYLMQDTRVSRQVAIKVVRAEGSAEGERATEATRLFQREAKAIAALEHPNILPLYDFGEETRDGMAITYMVMPYCADGSLESWQRGQSERFLPPQEVAYLVEQAAEALQYAHDHGVVHLDVKPSNFLLRRNRRDSQRPTLLLADFGIARNFTTVSSSSRTIRGTPTSMAPEQWSGSPVFASDQYALAVMAYELLAGRPPFTGSMEQLMYQHFAVQAPPPSKFNPHLPEALDAVLLRSLAKKPEERFPSVADFASAFAEAAQQPARTDDMSDYETLAVNQEQIGLSQLLTLADGQDETRPASASPREDQVIQAARTDEVFTPASDVLVSRVTPEDISLAHSEERVVKAPETPQIKLQPSPESPAEHDLPTVAASISKQHVTDAPRPPSGRRPGLRVFVSLVLVLVLVIGGVSFYVARQSGASSGSQSTPTSTAQRTATVLPTATPSPTPQPGLYIAGTYNGTMTDNNTQQVTQLSVHLVQTQGQGALRGSVTFNSSSQQVYLLNGVVDLKGNFSFTVQQPSGQTPYYFYGANQPGNYLHGYYCRAQAGPCLTNEGYFTVGPRF
jgi:serine/threonine protein kinase